ncbi:N-6 DNA methylase [Nonomuraea sp. NPDC050556]|uniref:N-6 DNA methylase n=1 Tax=Nonomuraea sp. NPDC050556 TaxID=3364369 RepID=UPI003791BC7F
MRPEYTIAEAVSETWYGYHGTGGIEIPIGVVASLLVTSPVVLKELPDMSDEEFVKLLRRVWGHWWLQHPHLADVARPITSWLDDPSPEVMKAAKAVARAAVRSRLKSFQGLDTDILSFVITELRSRGARKGLGEYHTPHDVCELMAQMKMRELPDKGSTLGEPTAGSGGMIRATARQIKRLGGDPADYVWHMADIDAIACACAAVNALVWNLGSEVYIFHGDILRYGDHFEQSIERRRQAVRAWGKAIDDALSAARYLRATRAFEGLVNARYEESRAPC